MTSHEILAMTSHEILAMTSHEILAMACLTCLQNLIKCSVRVYWHVTHGKPVINVTLQVHMGGRVKK